MINNIMLNQEEERPIKEKETSIAWIRMRAPMVMGVEVVMETRDVVIIIRRIRVEGML